MIEMIKIVQGINIAILCHYYHLIPVTKVMLITRLANTRICSCKTSSFHHFITTSKVEIHDQGYIDKYSITILVMKVM